MIKNLLLSLCNQQLEHLQSISYVFFAYHVLQMLFQRLTMGIGGLNGDKMVTKNCIKAQDLTSYQSTSSSDKILIERV